MAKPIKETPVLRGQDAVKFRQHMEKVAVKKVDPDAVKRMRESYDRIKAIYKP